MATGSRQSSIFGPNDWKKIYETFNQADFRSYDYETLRKSFIDYLRLSYPETFNDYIESSEFIALLDVMAFMGQGLSFRNDLNARENFIDTAERRDSVVKLSELVSYTPKRSLAGQGFLKITSIKTSENISDINGLNLSNVPVLWNDPANPEWLEQFNTVINAALVAEQKIGRPENVTDILGVTTSEYSIRIPQNTLAVVPFVTEVDGQNMNFELVSATTLNKDFVYEVAPSPSGKFNILQRNDRLGFGSPETGFFFYFKQGSLQSVDFNIQQQVANQTVDIDVEGINNEDTWLYQLEDDGERTLWTQVENIFADAFAQRDETENKLFSVSSRFNDQVTYVFGDGVFSEIPVGNFRAYVRSGNAQTYSIEPSEMQGVSVTLSYLSKKNRTETLTIGLELPLTVTNAQGREPLAEIKQRAPTRFYTQNRMVNGEDYSNFPFSKFGSIIKSKAVNRSSVGISKNLDLLDPTGNYSSITSFGNDGALYQEDLDQFLELTISSVSDIIAFFANDLAAALANNRATQYYIQNFARFKAPVSPSRVFWKLSTVDSSTQSGYLYTKLGALESPQSVGTFSSTTLKYITTGALLKFVAPGGFFFDSDNRLQPGIPGPGDSKQIWIPVLNVIGDGSNNGEGNFANGTGPIKILGFIPDGAILDEMIPVFDNVLSSKIVNECIIRMELQQDFSLVFDNSLTVAEERWFIRQFDDLDYFVRFKSLGDNRYSITYKSITYYFGSVADTRFAPTAGELVFDPFSGKIQQDFINMLSVNRAFNSKDPIGKDTVINILGQDTQSDGFANDFEVEVAATDINNNQIITNPDFFKDITGFVNDGANIGVYVFFKTVEDPVNLTRQLIVPTKDIVFQFATRNQIEVVKFEFPLGQVFYAHAEDKFYSTVQDVSVLVPSFTLQVRTDFTVKPGRQGLSFKYRHNSSDSTRVDPATTNIIDIYVVTQAYNTAFNNWVTDKTNLLEKPLKPTVAELSQEFGELKEFKMLSDTAILNSVEFKPLFGKKADPALRGTIKVVKESRTNASISEIRSAVLAAMNEYFDINNWDFGDTFYFSELSTFLHAECEGLISAAVIVPSDPQKRFGHLYEIKSKPFEIFVNAATEEDILVVPALTQEELGTLQ